jgi:hypothetical protein
MARTVAFFFFLFVCVLWQLTHTWHRPHGLVSMMMVVVPTTHSPFTRTPPLVPTHRGSSILSGEVLSFFQRTGETEWPWRTLPLCDYGMTVITDHLPIPCFHTAQSASKTQTISCYSRVGLKPSPIYPWGLPCDPSAHPYIFLLTDYSTVVQLKDHLFQEALSALPSPGDMPV